MPIICPTVLAGEPHEYREQMERIEGFAKRLQIDLSDGEFAPVKTIDVKQVWWPKNVRADIHLMYNKPLDHLSTIINLKPHMLIVHAEASGNFVVLAKNLKRHGIKTGIALLPETNVKVIKPAIDYIDHVLIFSGDLGRFGGTADTTLLHKARECRELNQSIEVGWDGGVNEYNAKLLAAGGVDVLNVGGSIHKADDPARAYATLEAALN